MPKLCLQTAPENSLSTHKRVFPPCQARSWAVSASLGFSPSFGWEFLPQALFWESYRRRAEDSPSFPYTDRAQRCLLFIPPLQLMKLQDNPEESTPAAASLALSSPLHLFAAVLSFQGDCLEKLEVETIYSLSLLPHLRFPPSSATKIRISLENRSGGAQRAAS